MFAVAAVGLRLVDRRTLAQLGPFDFAVAVAVGALIGRTATSSTTSFATGAVALVSLLLVHWVVTRLRRRGAVGPLFEGPPRVLIADGVVQDRELARAGLTTGDLYALLREQGVADLGEVRYALFETRGSLSLTRADSGIGPLTRDGLHAGGYRQPTRSATRG